MDYATRVAEEKSRVARCWHWLLSHASFSVLEHLVVEHWRVSAVSVFVATASSWLISHYSTIHLPLLVVVGMVIFVGVMVVWERTVPRPKPHMDIELIPSSGPRPDVLLTVKNRGSSQNFYAQCTPLALRNSPNALRRGTFDLKWEHTFDKCVPIGTGASRNLLIATFNEDHKNALATMEIWGLSGNTKKQCEWSRWNLDSREKIPAYDLEISIFSDSSEGPFSERFTLSSESWHGSPKMTRISEKETADQVILHYPR